MKWILQFRLLRVVACFVFLASCDSASTPSSASIGPSQISLTAPAMLTRAVDTGALFAEITLLYSFNSETITRNETAARTGNSNTWNAALDVPANTEFTMIVTWFDTTDSQRVDLTRLTRTSSTGAANSRISLVFDFSEYDSADFNLDGDAYTNLEERENGTSPFVPDEILLGDPVNIRYEENREYIFSRSEAELGGPSIIEARWNPLPHTEANDDACRAQPGFDSLLAETTLGRACTTSEDCALTFDQVVQDPQAEGSIDFSVSVPPLKSSVGVAYELITINNAQETNANRYFLCLIAINEPPVAVNDSFTATEGIPLTITAEQGVNLLSNDTDDTDASNAPLSIDTTPARAPARATTFALGSDGGFTYLHEDDPAITGTTSLSDSFDYTVSDGTFSSSATVSINIVSRDQPPVLISEIPAQSVVVGIDLSFDLSGFFEDPENSELSFSAAAGSLPPSGGVRVTEIGVLSGAAQPGDEGTYSVEIEARDQESSATGILALEVRANQRPVASAIADIGPVESGQLISVNVAPFFSDPEGAPLRFTLASNPASAMQINPATGLVTGRLANAGVYALTVSADDGITEPVSSSFSVTQNAAPVAILSVINPTSLNLSAQVNESDDGSISFRNNGNAPLNYTVASNQPWLTASPASGTVAAAASQTVSVSAQCGEAAATQSGTLTIGGNGGTRTVSVSIVCTAAPVPILSVINPTSLNLSAQVNQSDDGSISFSNQGNAPLNYTVASNQPWLTASPASGTVAAGADQAVSVSAQCGAAAATRSGTLTIGGNGGTRTVSVSIVCTAAPVPFLSVINPTSLNLSAQVNQSDTGAISFSNQGNAPLNYTVASNQPWLTASPTSGTVAAAASQTVSVSAQCGEAAATRSGTLTFGGNGGTRTVSVSIVCTAAPVPILSVINPTSLNLSAQVNQSDTGAISFSNQGNAPLNYTVASNQPWLTASPASGTVAAAADQAVSVSAQCGAAAATRSGTLTIGGNGGTRTVSVSIVCSAVPAPILSVINPTSLNLSAQVNQSDDGSISFSNQGNAPLNYTVAVASNQSWLTASPASGPVAAGADQTVSVSAQCGEAAVTRSGTLTIGGNGGTRTVSVSIVCSAVPAPILSVIAPTSLNLSAQVNQSDDGSISFSNEGNALLEYSVSSVSSEQSWITASPNSGTVAAGANQTVSVTALCGDGTTVQSGTLTIGGNGGTQSVTVSINCFNLI